MLDKLPDMFAILASRESGLCNFSLDRSETCRRPLHHYLSSRFGVLSPILFGLYTIFRKIEQVTINYKYPARMHVSMQAESADKQAQLQHQIAVNGQLMRRKEDMEWQLLTALAQVRTTPAGALACCQVLKPA